MIKVASYNIRKALGTDRRRAPERIIGILGEIDADIVALQEADRRFGVRHRVLPAAMLVEAGWHEAPVATHPASMGWHGNALLVRPSIAITSAARITLPAVEPRGAISADLRLPGGAAIRVVAAHLDLSGIRRRQQARAILADLGRRRPLPTLVLGDFNEWQGPLGCLHLFAAGFAQAPTEASFPARRPVARLDRIMASRALRVGQCGVHRSPAARIASDHLPIWAVIEGAG